MASYSRVAQEFNNFLSSLDYDKVSDYEKRLINIIQKNFNSIVETGTAGGKRARKLSEIIQKYGDNVPLTTGAEEISSTAESSRITNLLQISISNFRLFSKQVNIDFNKPYTLIYGPNGSGKSSFCEALECAMLGYLTEADNKKIKLEEYVKNVKTNKAVRPKLIARDESGACVEVKPEQAYNFCFVEKNRIEQFSRISSYSNSVQSESLSTLFGLEQFNNFVDEFTDNFEKYLDLKGVKKLELEQKMNGIEKHKHILTEFTLKVTNLLNKKNEILKKFPIKDNFDELDKYVHGYEQHKGRISEIDEELSKAVSKKYTMCTYSDLDEKAKSIKQAIENYLGLQTEYMNVIQKVNFRNLYRLVLELKSLSIDKCPVCETPINDGISKTRVNPYENAETKLKELEEISLLETKIENSRNNISEETNIIFELITQRNTVAEQLNINTKIDITPIKSNINLKSSKYITELNRVLDYIIDNNTLIKDMDTFVSISNKDIENMENKRKAYLEEKGVLLELSKLINDIKTREKSYMESIEQSSKAISDFNTQNKSLFDEVEKEKEKVVINNQYVIAYNTLISRLKEYKNRLPVSLVSNLNELTKEFYNTINRHDPSFELIEKIRLPLNSGDLIKVSFMSDKEKEYNALHILSEGHIKCLGLSILLAKNVYEQCSIIIFDDIVNAIDDDHRSGIRELIFENDRIKNKQIILTSHAEEFIKDLDNQIAQKQYNEYVQRINLLPPVDEREIRILSEAISYNYLEKAKQNLAIENKRESLRNCRTALENIINTFWKNLSRVYNTSITVKIRRPNDQPDLMSSVNGIRSFLIQLQKDIKQDIFIQHIDLLTYLGSIGTVNNIIWGYFNKGTHEEFDRAEFDKTIVSDIIDKLTKLDSLVKMKK